MRPLVSRLRAQPRRLLVLDGCGALASALLLGAVLPRVAPDLGASPHALYALAAAAVAIVLFDAVCVGRGSPRRALLAVAALNVAYPVATAAVLATDGARLTLLGWAYFVGEALVVWSLAVVEARVGGGGPSNA
jgi:hypothetical protein